MKGGSFLVKNGWLKKFLTRLKNLKQFFNQQLIKGQSIKAQVKEFKKLKKFPSLSLRKFGNGGSGERMLATNEAWPPKRYSTNVALCWVGGWPLFVAQASFRNTLEKSFFVRQKHHFCKSEVLKIALAANKGNF